MFKKIIFNTITLTTLLFSCLQLHTMLEFPGEGLIMLPKPVRISDGITDLENAKAGETYPQKIGLKEFPGTDVKEKVFYKRLKGAAIDKEGKPRKVYLIELPCLYQDWENKQSLCGSYTFENCKILAQKNLSLKKAVRKLNHYTTQQAEIMKRAKRFGPNVSNVAVLNEWGRESRISTYLEKPVEGFFEPNGRFKIKDNDAYAYVNFIETVNTGKLEIGKFVYDMIENFQDSEHPVEVFMMRYAPYSHYTVFRVEKTQDGNIAILFADSYFQNQLKSGFYKGYKTSFIDTIEKLGYTFDPEGRYPELTKEGKIGKLEFPKYEEEEEEEEEEEKELEFPSGEKITIKKDPEDLEFPDVE